MILLEKLRNLSYEVFINAHSDKYVCLKMGLQGKVKRPTKRIEQNQTQWVMSYGLDSLSFGACTLKLMYLLDPCTKSLYKISVNEKEKQKNIPEKRK